MSTQEKPELKEVILPSNKEIIVIAEHYEGDLLNVTLELLGISRELSEKLGGQVSAFLLGHNVKGLTQKLIEHGADKVYLADHKELTDYRTLTYRRVICDYLSTWEIPPHVVLVGATTTGRDLAPRIASYLHVGLTADCIEFDMKPYEYSSKIDPSKNGIYPNCLYAIRPSFGESLRAHIVGPWANPQMATARPGVMTALAADPSRTGEVIEVETNFQAEDQRLKIKEIVHEVNDTVDFDNSDVIVVGGFGLGNAEGYQLMQELADCFDSSAVGASRKAVDVGWIEYQHQIGQTGKTVRPRIMISCGVSGAIQHRVGISNSDCIIAINKDPDAPIFKFADHGIVGDLYQIVPELIAQIKANKKEAANV